MHTVNVTDLYEAAYLLICQCTLEEVSCIPLSSSLACRMTFSGLFLAKAQENYYARTASVNLHEFRSAYSQINSYVHEAKKSFDRERRIARRSGSTEDGNV